MWMSGFDTEAIGPASTRRGSFWAYAAPKAKSSTHSIAMRPHMERQDEGRIAMDGCMSEAPVQADGDAAPGRVDLLPGNAVGEMFVIPLVEQVGQTHVDGGGRKTARLAETPAEIGVGGDEAGGLVFRAGRELLRDAVLFRHHAQLAAPVEAALGGLAQTQAQFVGGHLVQRFVVLMVLAAHPGEARVRDEYAQRHADAAFQPPDGDLVEVLGLLDGQAVHRMIRAGDASGNVVVDAGVESRQLILEPPFASFHADFETGRAFRIELRVADMEEAVAARRFLEALAHIGGAIGAADIAVHAELGGERTDGAEGPRYVAFGVIEAGG